MHRFRVVKCAVFRTFDHTNPGRSIITDKCPEVNRATRWLEVIPSALRGLLELPCSKVERHNVWV